MKVVQSIVLRLLHGKWLAGENSNGLDLEVNLRKGLKCGEDRSEDLFKLEESKIPERRASFWPNEVSYLLSSLFRRQE